KSHSPHARTTRAGTGASGRDVAVLMDTHLKVSWEGMCDKRLPRLPGERTGGWRPVDTVSGMNPPLHLPRDPATLAGFAEDLLGLTVEGVARRIGQVAVAALDREDPLPAEPGAGCVRAGVALRPTTIGADDVWLAADLSEIATGRPLPADHVLGLGGASGTLVDLTVRTPVERALDLGTGSGIQTLGLATHAE